MSLYPTILLAVNPDDKEAHKLMIKAAVIAEQNNAELHLAYVEPGIGNVSYMDVELELDEVHNALEIKRMQQLADLAKQSPYPVGEMYLADGDVAKHLVELAKKVDAKLVIVGYHKTFLHLFGDVADELSKHLECDVLTCR
ncbi:TPA: universal stress protein [Photobacterium damselae]|uniref:Universal stress protein n=3 Tax=Photobacterium damselae TaxID=38293 RepID=A0A2T3Q9Z2_PHODM|nr:universal stress protein [Photobacterium damselae]ARR50512.1 universal stress protein [Photobacterium damselae subsp. damselae]AWK80670.1 universal stress protein [Photobacterium damselae]EHA1082749.1 universal stress protein [Photobacterium damselae]ELI6449908.1 universal stress protein [Photobacterium damselae]ELV7516985.1 universal stress protein [Photobacterium damselae]